MQIKIKVKNEYYNLQSWIDNDLTKWIDSSYATKSWHYADDIKIQLDDETNETLQDWIDDETEINDSEEDNNTGYSTPSYNEDIKELDIFGKINLSIKLMEIIGQIAKNYYGSLTKSDKSILLTETCSLSLRNLNLFIKLTKRNIKARSLTTVKDMIACHNSGRNFDNAPSSTRETYVPAVLKHYKAWQNRVEASPED
jgi:hypothetical protein